MKFHTVIYLSKNKVGGKKLNKEEHAGYLFCKCQHHFEFSQES